MKTITRIEAQLSHVPASIPHIAIHEIMSRLVGQSLTGIRTTAGGIVRQVMGQYVGIHWAQADSAIHYFEKLYDFLELEMFPKSGNALFEKEVHVQPTTWALESPRLSERVYLKHTNIEIVQANSRFSKLFGFDGRWMSFSEALEDLKRLDKDIDHLAAGYPENGLVRQELALGLAIQTAMPHFTALLDSLIARPDECVDDTVRPTISPQISMRYIREPLSTHSRIGNLVKSLASAPKGAVVDATELAEILEDLRF